MPEPSTPHATVADLLADPSRWCQHDYAKSADGAPAEPLSASACRWCPVGAIERIYGTANGAGVNSPNIVAKTKLRRAIGDKGMYLAGWNDEPGRTHGQVLEAVRAAGI